MEAAFLQVVYLVDPAAPMVTLAKALEKVVAMVPVVAMLEMSGQAAMVAVVTTYRRHQL